MTAQTKAANKLKFETGDVPTETDFADLIDSYQDVLAEGAFVDGDKTRLDAAVTKTGTPVDNQVVVWTGDGTAEGDADLLFDGTMLKILDGTTEAAAWPDSSAKLAAYSDSADLDVIFGTASATVGHRNILNLARSRGADAANPAAVADNDYLGSIQARGYASGGTFPVGARIDFLVDGTPGASTVPTEMLFMTGQSLGTLAARFRISAAGVVSFHDAYSLPATIGTAGQVLKVPAAGTALEWGTGSGGGIDWSDPVDADVIPDTDGTRDLGATATRFAVGYLDSVVTGALTIDGAGQLSDPNADRLLGWNDSGGTSAWMAPANGLEISGTDLQLTANQRISAFEFVISGGGSAITTGVKGFLRVPMACTITKGSIIANATGSIVVDVWKDTFANHPPTDADSITASAPLTISSAVAVEDSTLTGWSKSLSAGDVLAFNVDSATTIALATVIITVTVT